MPYSTHSCSYLNTLTLYPLSLTSILLLFPFHPSSLLHLHHFSPSHFLLHILPPYPPSYPPTGRNPSAMLLSLSPLQEDEAGNTIELLHADSESQGPGSAPGPPATSSAAKRDLKKASSARVYRISLCAGATLCASLYFKPSRSKVWDFELPLRLQGISSEKMSFSEGAVLRVCWSVCLSSIISSVCGAVCNMLCAVYCIVSMLLI